MQISIEKTKAQCYIVLNAIVNIAVNAMGWHMKIRSYAKRITKIIKIIKMRQ